MEQTQREITVVGFAGGGGSCEGIRMALGHSPDVALNHDEVAVAMHTANHPDTVHYCQNIWKAVPSDVLREVKKQKNLPRMPKIGLAWFSPDCKHFSKAKGSKPVEKRIRDLAWVIVAWAKLPRAQRPRIIMVENVEEFITWGPLGPDGRPCPERSGEYFRRWVGEFKKLGYKADWREIVAANKGTPTTRKRLFIVFRNDGMPIVMGREDRFAKPAAPHIISKIWMKGGERRPLPWRTAAECIDWSLPCPSIFDTSAQIKAKHGVRAIRPLAENTLARIARGVKRYVIDAAEPFIVPITHTGDARVHGLDEPMRTLTTAHRGEHALVTPFVTKFREGSTGSDMRAPLGTVTANSFQKRPGGAAPFGVVMPFLARQFGASVGSSAGEPAPTVMPNGGGKTAVIAPVLVKNYHGDKPYYGADEPTRTILTGQHHMLVAASLINTRNGEREGQEPRCRDVEAPYPTVTAKGSQGAVVTAFLAQHNTDMVGHDMREPVSTIVQKGCTQAIVSAGLVNLKGSERRQSPIDAPAPTQTAGGFHVGAVSAFLTKFYGTPGDTQAADEPMHAATGKARFGLVHLDAVAPPFGPELVERARAVAKFMRDRGLWDDREFVTVTIGGTELVIADLGMRMLIPRELFTANGFPLNYIIDRGLWPDGTWRPITKTDQIRMCGNAVCPQVAEDLVLANYTEEYVDDRGIPDFALVAAE